MRFLPLLFLLGACLQPDLVACGESLCPPGTVCFGDGRCVDEELVTQCEAVDEGTICETLAGLGRCIGGLCEESTCGDGYVDDPLHEACDGSTDAQCVDFGFDLGRPACANCAIDTSPCVRFGWVRVEYASSQSFWTDGTTTVYTTYSPIGLVARGPGLDIQDANRYFHIAGGGGKAFAVRDNGQLYELGGTAPQAIAHPGLYFFGGLAVADDGVPFLMTGCTVYAYRNGTWEQLGKSGPISETNCTEIDVEGTGPTTKLAVSMQNNKFFVLDAQDRFIERAGPEDIVQMRVHDEHVLFATETGLFRFLMFPITPAPAPTPLIAGNLTSFAFIGDRIYATTNDGLVLRYNGSRVDTLRGPTGGLVADDGHDALYMFSGPIYRFTGTAFGELVTPPVSVLEEQISAACRAGPDELYAMADLHIFRLGKSEVWTQFDDPLQPTYLKGLACGGRGDVAIATSVEEDHSYIARWTEGLDEPLSLIHGLQGAVCDAVWIAPDGALFGVGVAAEGKDNVTAAPGWVGELAAAWVDDHDAHSLQEYALSETLGACRFVAVHGTDATHVVAAGRCDKRGTIIERMGPGDWRIIYQSPAPDAGFRAVARTIGGRVFASGDDGTVWFDNGTWHVEPMVIGQSLSGSANDMWLSGAFTNVQHFDGTSWSQVATAALTRIAVSAGVDDVVFPGGAPGHVNLIRDRQVVPP